MLARPPPGRQQLLELPLNIPLTSTVPARFKKAGRPYIKTAKLEAAIKDGFLPNSQPKE